MLAEAVNRLTRKNKFHLQLVSFTAKNRETKKKWFNKHSLDIFLNSLFNTSSALAEHLSDHLDKYIGYLEVGSKQGSTPGLVFLIIVLYTHTIVVTCSCKISLFVL